MGLATRWRRSSTGQSLRGPPWTAAIAALIFAFGGVVLTAATVTHRNEANAAEAQRKLDLRAASWLSAITARMADYEYVLRGLRSTIVAVGVEKIDPLQFNQYSESQSLTHRFPGLDSIGVIRILDPQPATANDAQRLGRADPRPAAPGATRRAQYSVPLAIPVDANATSLGVEVAADSTSLLAAEQSLRSQEPTLSGLRSMPPDGKPHPATLAMLLPIYPADVARRGDGRAWGWVYASIDVSAELRGLKLLGGDLDLSLRDISAPNSQMLFATPSHALEPSTALESRIVLHPYQRTWEATVKARPHFIASLDQPDPRMETAIGCTLTAMLSLMLFLAIRRHGQFFNDAVRGWFAGTSRRNTVPAGAESLFAPAPAANSAVAQRTASFDSIQHDLHTILDAMPAMIAYWDKDLINRFANRASEVSFDVEPGSLRGQHLRELLGEELFSRDLQHIEAALRGDLQTFEQATSLADGTGYRYALIHYIPDVECNAVHGFYALVYDVTEITESRLRLAAALRENEELLRTLDLHSKVSITDDKGYITYVNDNFCRILGFQRNEVLGRSHSIINSGVHSRAQWTRMWDVIATGQPWRGEICNRAKDGTLHWADIIIAPFLGNDGRVQKYVSIGTNISAAKATELKLRNNEAFLERIGMVAGVGGWEFDLDTRALTWSPQTYRLLDVEQDYKPSADTELTFYASEARPAIREAIYSCEMLGTSWDLELAAVTASGRAIWVRSVGALERENGKPVRIIGALQDITTRKTAEIQLQESSERFSIAADSAGIGVWEMDAAHDTLTWDDWMYRIYGIERTGEPASYSTWLAALHPDDRERFQAAATSAFLGAKDFNSEFRIVRPNGDVRYIKAASRGVRGSDGIGVRTTGVNFDVTESRLSEMVARRETASLLRTVLDAASEVSIIATDHNLNIKVFNAGAEMLLGFSSADVVGREMLLRIHDPDDLETCSRSLRIERKHNVSKESVITDPSMLDRSLERIYMRKDRRRVRVSLFVTPMLSDEGETMGYVCVARDITQQKEDETALLAAMAKADKANSAKSLFLANMSHEIRTPMSAVIGLSYLLQHTALTPEQSGFLNKIQTASNSLLSIITNILDLSKIEASELLVESTVFSLDDLLRDVAAMMLVQANAKAIEFSMRTPHDLPEALSGDPTRLRQILINLLSNAIRFTNAGRVQLTVSRSPDAATPLMLSFIVTDTGSELRPKLARAFSRHLHRRMHPLRANMVALASDFRLSSV